MKRPLVALTAVCVLLLSASLAEARVLRVGTYHGKRGQYQSIQAAVNAAHPGDWILVGPGDYKEHSGRAPAGFPDRVAGVADHQGSSASARDEPQHGDRRRYEAGVTRLQQRRG